jgi:hypothetical protein
MSRITTFCLELNRCQLLHICLHDEQFVLVSMDPFWSINLYIMTIDVHLTATKQTSILKDSFLI